MMKAECRMHRKSFWYSFRVPRSAFRVLRLLCGVLVVLTVTTATASGEEARPSSVGRYRERVHGATMALDTLAATDEDASEEEHAGAVAEMIGEVREMLPPKERVEWEGGTLEVDNAWLHAALDAYQSISSSSVAERADALARIVERLRALDERLAALDEAANAAATDRRVGKEGLEAILRRPEYAPAQPRNESALSRFHEQVREWFKKLVPEQRALRPGASPRLSRAAQIFIWVLSLAVIVFVVWKYGARFWSRGRLTSVKLRRQPRVVLGEHLAADETSADLLAAAEQLAREGNLRGAIRKAYVALLCELGDRKILRLAQHKTNRDYLQTLRREQALLCGEVEPLTLNFERHWYGSEAATLDDWTDFRTRCRQVLMERSSQ